MGHDFPPGSLVRLVNLNKADLNHHLGRVTVVSSNSERVGVRLHGALWQDSKVESESSKAILGIKKENLRLVPRPAPGTLLPVLDSINQRTVSRLMGESGWGLPENVVAAIATWLELRSVQPSDITVTSCSSGRGDYPISAVLNDRDDQWWISDSGSCPDGHGREYLEFSFGPEPRRVTCVAVKIPPLPYGPLSVRDFHLEVPKLSEWEEVSQPLMTLDSPEMQEFVLCPPLECQKLRLVCTRNAMAALKPTELLPRRGADCIGLFQVGFA